MAQTTLQDLLQDARKARIHSLPEKQQLAEACAALGFTCLNVDLRNTPQIKEVLSILGRELDFPDWYGSNFDALYDCLSDFPRQEAAGCVITLANANTLATADPEAFKTLNAVFSEVIVEKSARGSPLWILYSEAIESIPAFPDPA